MRKDEGVFTDLIADDDGLHIILHDEGREALQDSYSNPHDLFYELMEEHMANDLYEILFPEEIGALTSAPIIGYDVLRDDSGDLIEVQEVYWFPDYQVIDPIEELLEKGEVFFEKGEEE